MTTKKHKIESPYRELKSHELLKTGKRYASHDLMVLPRKLRPGEELVKVEKPGREIKGRKK